MSKVSHSRRRADRIRASIPMVRVLYDYGYAVHPDGGDREQQFQCDLHGDGKDGKPSGRLYPSSNSMYCFACGRSRDSITLTMEKEGVKFPDACLKLEKRYGLPALPMVDGDDEEDDSTDIKASLAETPVSFEDAVKRTERFLRLLTEDRSLPMGDTLRLWSNFDRVRHGVANEGWDEPRGAVEVDVVRIQARSAVGITDDG